MKTRYSKTGDTLNIYIAPNTLKKQFDPILAELEKLTFNNIRVDLKNVFYMKSEELSNLIAIKKLASQKKSQVYLLNLNENIYQILEMSNLLKIFNTEQDFKSYNDNELLDMFHNDETADKVSKFMAKNYDQYKKLLFENVFNDDPVICENCILTIGKVQDSDASEILKKSLESEYSNIVKAALQVLGWLLDTSSKEQYYKLIQADDKEVSEAAGAALAMVSDENDITKLEKIKNNSNPDVRSVVAKTLSLINGAEAFSIIKNMLSKETDDDVRRNLVKSISYFNEPEATDILISFLDGSSPMPVQEAAAAGLQRTGLRGHDKEILQKVHSTDIWISYFAVKALGKNCSEAVAEELIKVYESSEDNVKLAIIESVSASTFNSTPFLLKQLENKNEDIRKEALLALYRSDPESGLQKVGDLLSKDPSWIVRYNALEIIEKTHPEGFQSILKNLNDENNYVKEKANKILAGWV